MNVFTENARGMGISGRGEQGSATRKSLYLRVREQVLQDLITRSRESDDRYYTETELAKRFNVCRNTVRKAMGDLEREGYISRHRKIGTIINKKSPKLNPDPSGQPLAADSPQTEVRQRVVVILPMWNDTVEGFYTGRLLRALSAPELDPPLAVEIRHYNDPLILAQPDDAAIVPIDPHPGSFDRLQKLAAQGVRIIAIEPRQPIPGLINLFTDRRTVVCQAVTRFYEMGHRAVGIINSTLHHMDFERSLLGYLDAHRELDIPIPPTGIEQEAIMADVSPVPDVKRVSAWVCTYMRSIYPVANECWRAGLSIPQDVSLVCLDDPGEVPLAPMGKKVSVVCSNSAAAASLIHGYLADWREDRLGMTFYIPSEWKDRETIAPPKAP